MNWYTKVLPETCIMALQKEFNEETAASGIPEFYSEYARSDFANSVPARIGICQTPEFGYNWIYAIGNVCDKSAHCPDGFDLLVIPEQEWAIFTCGSSNELWNYIYGEWFLTSGYEILPGFTLEYYDANGTVSEIHIPVRKIQ